MNLGKLKKIELIDQVITLQKEVKSLNKGILKEKEASSMAVKNLQLDNKRFATEIKILKESLGNTEAKAKSLFKAKKYYRRLSNILAILLAANLAAILLHALLVNYWM